MDIKATCTEAVDTVNFTAFNLISGDNSSYEDDNGSDGFSASLELPLGLYQLTVSAFDADENLIGIEQVDYLVFISRGGSEEPFDRVGRFRQRLRDCLIK